MKIAVIRYSQLIPTDISATIVEFVKKTGLTQDKIWKIAGDELKEAGIIYQYKIGKINTDEFRTKLSGALEVKGGHKLAEGDFDSCWKAMCQIDKIVLPELPQKNIYLHVIGDTNKLQHEFIQKGLTSLFEQHPNMKISYTLSFEKGTLELVLLKESAEQYITETHPDLDIVWHNNEDDNTSLANIIAELTGEQISDNISYEQIDNHNSDKDSSESFEKLGGVEGGVDVLGDKAELLE